MSIQNQLAAKIIGEILSEGMSLSDINLADSVKSEAIDALCEIQAAVYRDGDAPSRLKEIRRVIEKYLPPL